MRSSLRTVLIFLLPICLAAQTDFNQVKSRVISQIQTAQVNDATVEKLLSTIKPNGTWPNINYEDVSRTGFQHKEHLDHLFALSLAYQDSSSGYHENPEVLTVFNRGLRHWTENDYLSDNWWFNEIYTPKLLVTSLLLLQDAVAPELVNATIPIIARSHLEADGARPGGDRIKLGTIQALRQLLLNDEEGFGRVMKLIDGEVAFATLERGLQRDNSFHHRADRVNNTVSYGHNHAQIFAEWADYVADTRYAFSEPKQRMLIDYYLDGISRQYVYGLYADVNAKNRSVSREAKFEPLSTLTAERLLRVSDYRSEELEKLIALRNGESVKPASFATYFWHTEHFVCQRPDFFASVRMFSTRNANMEEPYNSEGLRNHHRGDGAVHLHKRGDEYLNVWPVYDYQKIPGTTIRQKEDLPPPNQIQRWGLTDFVGAVTDGYYGAVGFDFISPHDFTRARKAWFFFEDEYVCLGAGIEGLGKGEIVTTLEQSLLKGEVKVGHEERESTLASGNVRLNWVFHNGVGYRFLKPTLVNLATRSRSGSWYDINKQWNTPRDTLTKNLFTLWIDHGPSPQEGAGGWGRGSTQAKDITYAYIVEPNSSVERLAAGNFDLEVLANNRWLQAVTHRGLGLTQIIAYRAGTLELENGLKLFFDSPGAFLFKSDNGNISSITAADPSRSLGKMHLRYTEKGLESPREAILSLPKGEFAGSSIGWSPG